MAIEIHVQVPENFTCQEVERAILESSIYYPFSKLTSRPSLSDAEIERAIQMAIDEERAKQSEAEDYSI